MTGCVSGCIGRALEWHSRGKGFDPPHLHQKKKRLLSNMAKGVSICALDNTQANRASERLIDCFEARFLFSALGKREKC